MKVRHIAALLIGAISLTASFTAWAAVPEYGTVVEGQGVPGVSLGNTRAQVTAAFGEPTRCESGQTAGDGAYCIWVLEDYLGQGGDIQSQVGMGFRDPEGGNPSDDPDDSVSSIRWYGIDGWYTTTGVNALFAAENQDEVIALYPDAVVFHQSMFDTHMTAYEQGFSVSWHTEYLTGHTSVRLSVFEPRDPPPPRDPFVIVSEISMDLYKRQVFGKVRVLNDLNWRMRGAEVYATWTLPDGTIRIVEAETDSFGLAVFEVNKARKGIYTLTIDDVVVEDHPFDAESSIMNASIFKKR